MGGISDELRDNFKILFGGWIAPKLHILEYAEKISDVVLNIPTLDPDLNHWW